MAAPRPLPDLARRPPRPAVLAIRVPRLVGQGVTGLAAREAPAVEPEDHACNTELTNSCV
jgi:hypothetical protein